MTENSLELPSRDTVRYGDLAFKYSRDDLPVKEAKRLELAHNRLAIAEQSMHITLQLRDQAKVLSEILDMGEEALRRPEQAKQAREGARLLTQAWQIFDRMLQQLENDRWAAKRELERKIG